MAEKEFFNHDGVIITSSRAVFRDTMYPISSISAVEQVKTKVFVSFKPMGYLLLIVFILLFVFDIHFIMNFSFLDLDNDKKKVEAIFVAFFGFYFTAICFSSAQSHTNSKDKFHINFYISGTNTEVFSSTSKKEIDDIVQAINEAIIARG
jgi:hypothetical protein